MNDIVNIEVLTGNEIIDNLIRASMFCTKSEKNVLKNVYISEDEMYAGNGFRRVIIRCNDIPSELKNKAIEWNKIYTLNENIVVADEYLIDYYNFMKEDIEMLKEKNKCIYYIELNRFIDDSLYKTVKVNQRDIVVLKKKDVKVAFNQSDLIYALESFKTYYETNPLIKIYFPDYINAPILIENENHSVIVLPKRLCNNEY